MSELNTIQKLNESYSYIDADSEVLVKIHNHLKLYNPESRLDPLCQRGLKDPNMYFSFEQNKKLVVMNGHIPLVTSHFPDLVNKTPQSKDDYTIEEIDLFFNDVITRLPFVPHDFQYKAFAESLLYKKQINIMSTSSGKSLTIALILEFLRRKGKRGLLLVPNINLLTQFKADIKEYKLDELYDDTRVIGGGETERVFDTALTISTWQSLQDYQHLVSDLDYLICDELQYYASEVTSEIVKNTFECTMKLGFTGTLPENPCKKMTLVGLFGLPKTYITPRQLIDRGLATPIKIHTLKMQYEPEEIKYHNGLSVYNTKLKYIKEHDLRNRFCVDLMVKLRKVGNTLLLFQHTDHGKLLFTNLMKELYPDVEVLNKNITGKKSFEFQSQYGVYFLNGEDDAKTRELTRKILETHDNATIISNYALMSTGVSVKRLHNAILASPLKSYTAITQTIGRGMRLYKGKLVFNVFDIVDCLKPFMSQYAHRLKTSYNREQHPVLTHSYNLVKHYTNDDW